MSRILKFEKTPRIIATSTICGPKEASGNLGKYIDKHLLDDYNNEKNFELAERKMLSYTIESVVEKCKLKMGDIDLYIGGDLLNQIISSSFCAREYSLPFLGVYTACATMAESMIIGASLVNGGLINNCICATCSHFSTAERQYRFPLEQGCTRPPQSQWTVTGAGANIISNSASGVKITSALVGRVIEYGVVDVNNMGAAMAPAVAHSLIEFFDETQSLPNHYDLILTGDLGSLGSRIFKEVIKRGGYSVDKNHVDCGELIYNIEENEYQGGSGAGCSAVVFNSYIYKKMVASELKRVLFIPTGALLSTVS